MSRYLLIESRDPFESRDTAFIVDSASALKARGHEVTVFLVQNAVLAARKNAKHAMLSSLVQAGVTLLADEFSLHERGIQTAELHSNLKASSIDALVDMLVQENTKAIWH